MRISRFYFPELPADSAPGQSLVLPANIGHYATRVLRLAAGAQLQVFDGTGREFSATLTEAGKKQAVITLHEMLPALQESGIRIHLALGLTRGERMDYAIQKATELGANTFTPIISERCEVKLSGDRVEKRRSHWQQVAISACEQSGRSTVPKVETPVSLSTLLANAPEGMKLVLDHRQSTAMASEQKVKEAMVLTGPEGGLTAGEIELAIKAGFQPVRLGARVLRAETAPVVAASLLQWLWGDFRE